MDSHLLLSTEENSVIESSHTNKDQNIISHKPITSWDDYYTRLCSHISHYPTPLLEKVFMLVRAELLQRNSDIQCTPKKRSKTKLSSFSNSPSIQNTESIQDHFDITPSRSQPSTPKRKEIIDSSKLKLEDDSTKEIRTKGRLSNFFSILRKSNQSTVESEIDLTPFDEYFKPFFIKPNVTIAHSRQLGIKTVSNLSYVNALKQSRCNNKNAMKRFSWNFICSSVRKKLKEHVQSLEEIRLGSYFPKALKRLHLMPVMNDEITHESLDNISGNSQLVTTQLPLIRFKLCQFHDNYRPAYFGTWTKYSSTITPRRPFEHDLESGMNYDIDSDEEWQENDLMNEEGVENLSNSDESEDDDEQDESDKEWLVPHGYLSEDEGISEDEDSSLNRERQIEYPRSNESKSLIPKVIGLVYRDCISSKKYTIYELERLASCSFSFIPDSLHQIDPFKISYHVLSLQMSQNLLDQQALMKQLPILSDVKIAESIHLKRDKRKDISEQSDITCKAYQKFDDNMIIKLVHLIHGSSDGLTKLYEEFKKVGSVSKRQFEFKVFELAIKEKRPLNTKICWYVKDQYLKQFGLHISVANDISITDNVVKMPIRRRITPEAVINHG